MNFGDVRLAFDKRLPELETAGDPAPTAATNKRALKDHSRGTVDETCWGEWLDIAGTPLIPLIRGIDQPFDSDTEEAGI